MKEEKKKSWKKVITLRRNIEELAKGKKKIKMKFNASTKAITLNIRKVFEIYPLYFLLFKLESANVWAGEIMILKCWENGCYFLRIFLFHILSFCFVHFDTLNFHYSQVRLAISDRNVVNAFLAKILVLAYNALIFYHLWKWGNKEMELEESRCFEFSDLTLYSRPNQD